MKKMLALLLALVLMVAFVGCAPKAEEPAPKEEAPAADAEAPAEKPADEPAEEEAPAADSEIQKIKDAGELVMLTNAAFPPFEYLGDDNLPAGVDVDIANEIAKELGVELKVVDMDFDGIIGALMAGKGNIAVAGMTVTEERLKSVDFSTKYITSAQYMIVQKGNTEIAALEDLSGKIIGVQEGTTGDLYASDEWDDSITVGAKSVERFKTAIEAANALANGKVDVVIVDEMPAKSIVAQNADALEVVDNALTAEDYAIAINKGSDLTEFVNAKLEEMLADGTIEGFIVKHTS